MEIIFIKSKNLENSLMVQLGLCFHCHGHRFDPNQGTKIPERCPGLPKKENLIQGVVFINLGKYCCNFFTCFHSFATYYLIGKDQ